MDDSTLPSPSSFPPPPETPAKHIERMLNANHRHRSPSRTIYSDRFFPSRSASNFGLFNLKSPTSSLSEDTSYTTLLRAALFGPQTTGVAPPATLDRRGLVNPPNQNIFSFKSQTRRSVNSLLPFGFDDDVITGVQRSPVKTPRKVSRSPYKVLDAPALQDDFYLNLVDWSSSNLLAVGLGNCVYLWNACTSKVTKLCDLGSDDSVCLVGWAQRGAHLPVGTGNGKVQIWDAS